MPPVDARATVVEVVERPHPYFTLTLDGPPEWAETRAGQFVMVESADGMEPYLRRAFSVHDVSRADRGTRIELLAKIVGPGTRALSRRRVGETLSVLGPLGRGFLPTESGRAALVAGGVGSAPLLLLGRALAARGVPFDFFYGGRSAIDLVLLDRFRDAASASGGELVATTEDGSVGERGVVTAPLEPRLEQSRYQALYACGPMGLLARLADLSARHRTPGEAALETPMGCGFGACLGCAVPLASGRYGLCCKDGPVFPFDAVRW